MRCSVPSALVFNARHHSSNEPFKGNAVLWCALGLTNQQISQHRPLIQVWFWTHFSTGLYIRKFTNTSTLLLFSRVLCRKSSEIILFSITILLCFVMDVFSPEHIHHNFTSLSHKVTIEQKSVCLCDIYLWKKLLLLFILLGIKV